MIAYCKKQLKIATLLIEDLGFLFEKSDVFFDGNEKDNLYKN